MRCDPGLLDAKDLSQGTPLHRWLDGSIALSIDQSRATDRLICQTLDRASIRSIARWLDRSDGDLLQNCHTRPHCQNCLGKQGADFPCEAETKICYFDEAQKAAAYEINVYEDPLGRASVRPSIHPFVPPSVCSSVRPSVPPFVWPFANSSVRLSIQ